MLEEVRRVNTYQAKRDVAAVSPYPRIDPKQERQEGYQEQQPEAHPQGDRQRRRFSAMRDIIEELRDRIEINHVDFNTLNQELFEQGFSILEEQLVTQLLEQKLPLSSIEALGAQLRNQKTPPALTAGRKLSADNVLLGFSSPHLSEYIMRFEGLEIAFAENRDDIYREVNTNSRYVIERDQLRLRFFPLHGERSVVPGDALGLMICIKLAVVEVDEDGRRAIFYQRPDQSCAIYSDKLLNLSI